MTSHRYQIATGASDDTIRIWDLRSLKALYTIPAHLSNVSDVRFFRSDGTIPAHIARRQPNGPADADGMDEDSERPKDDGGQEARRPCP
jgi:U4/U6 small nuclear ribonucleoprotein PRP4